MCQVVKDPINLKYYRLSNQEHFVFNLLDGHHTLDQVQKEFESRFPPDRLSLEDLEAFARQLVTNGLVQHESPNTGQQLFQKLGKQKWTRRLANFTNILYIKIPVFDPDRVLNWMYRYLYWIFTNWFLILSIGFMLSAVALVAMKFQIFWDKLPAYQEFFRFRTLLYMWISLGIVKVIHEFGHGLSCKAFGGECHQMGVLLMCFSPSLFCNVSDAWTLANKWQRVIISFAGIYVELIIAAASTFVWWYTPHWPFVNNIALCLMTLCSVSTFLFNANPLMRFDGYYIMADMIEVPNLREKSNRFLSNLASDKCLGVEVPPQQYMAPWRKWLFAGYAIASWIYRWVVTFGILYFMATWLKPYKLEHVSIMLAAAALLSMVFWPLFRVAKNIRQRGRLPDMKRKRVWITSSIAAAVILAFFLLPLPINRVRETGLVQVQESAVYTVAVPDPGGILRDQFVQDSDHVVAFQDLAIFFNQKQEARLAQLDEQVSFLREQKQALHAQLRNAPPDPEAKSQYKKELSETEDKLKTAETQLADLQRVAEELRTLRASKGGIVMSAPKRDDMFKFWDKAEAPPFCRIGDLTKLRVLVPVSPPEYREIKENLLRKRTEQPDAAFLEASILVANRSDHIYTGRVTKVPDMNEANIPTGLTSRGGGPVAIRPAQDQNQNSNRNEPVAQTYLIQVEVLDPDGTILPGVQAKVKIHLGWRSGAWWVNQKLASALDWGLW